MAVLLDYTVSAADLGSAISIAQRRAIADGFTHTSVNSTRQLRPTSWVVVIFATQSGSLTRR